MNNRAKRIGNLYVALVVILMAVAIIAAIAGAMSRSKQTAEKGIGKNTDTTAVEDAVKNKETEPASEDVFKPTKNEETKVDETTSADEETEKTEAEPLPQFVNPTNGSLVKDYSVEVPVFSVTMEDYRTHNGVDIYVQKGERILAAAAGTVKEIWEDPMMGTCMSISHTGGAETIYKNLAPEIPEGITVGAQVSEGSFIAVGGESALTEISEEPHLHFEMKVNGEFVNPCDYINFENSEEVFEG